MEDSIYSKDKVSISSSEDSFLQSLLLGQIESDYKFQIETKKVGSKEEGKRIRVEIGDDEDLMSKEGSMKAQLQVDIMNDTEILETVLQLENKLEELATSEYGHFLIKRLIEKSSRANLKKIASCVNL